jgi:hypothetical protein
MEKSVQWGGNAHWIYVLGNIEGFFPRSIEKIGDCKLTLLKGDVMDSTTEIRSDFVIHFSEGDSMTVDHDLYACSLNLAPETLEHERKYFPFRYAFDMSETEILRRSRKSWEYQRLDRRCRPQ